MIENPGKLCTDRIRACLAKGVQEGVFPGASLRVGNSDVEIFSEDVGNLAYQSSPLVNPETCYDLASLTKVMVTGILAAKAVDENKWSLDQPVSEFVSPIQPAMTIRHLLSHSSGLPAWRPLYQNVSPDMTRDQVRQSYVEQIAAEKSATAPGAKAEYSDLGFLLLGFALEGIFAESLDQLAEQWIFSRLQSSNATYHPTHMDRIAPTEDCPLRKYIVQGEVHDLNAWALGGSAGHAGVFATANDVAIFARSILRNLKGEKILVSPQILREFSQRQKLPGDSTWALSWDTPSKEESSAGCYWSKTGMGHLGYTGCSIWLDPPRDLYVVCLTNRIHPSDSNKTIRQFRPQLHNTILEQLEMTQVS